VRPTPISNRPAPPSEREHLPCRAYGRFSFLSSHPAVMSGLAMITNALVSMVTRVCLSLIRPSSCRLSVFLLTIAFSVIWGGSSW
jgi:hypothetical protein